MFNLTQPLPGVEEALETYKYYRARFEREPDAFNANNAALAACGVGILSGYPEIRAAYEKIALDLWARFADPDDVGEAI